ncbi:MAG TPA: methionyl-tRNA formyltransferase [Solirubrobacteraceae bacterium]
MSTVFLGTTEFAADVLERLAASDAYRPALVVTRPDRPSGRGRRLAAPPVAEAARRLGIALEQPENVNDEQSRAAIARAGSESGAGGSNGAEDATDHVRRTVVVCAFGALIREPLLSEHDLLNVHPSLLPRWRGAAPIERAIMAGDARTGVSIMRLTAGLDSGPVCLTAEEPVLPDETYGSLAPRLSKLGGELLVRALEERLPFVEQPSEGVTYAEKVGPEDRLLDPARPAVELERVVRGLHPHIGARVALRDGTLLGVHRAALAPVDTAGGEGLGQSVLADGDPSALGVTVRADRLLLDCAVGVLELLVVQPPGGRAMDAGAFLRGHGLPDER